MERKHTKILVDKLWPINRSITGRGLYESLKILKKDFKKLTIKTFKSGNKYFDWKIPKIWEINEAYLSDSDGKRILDFKDNNLHVINYSAPIDKINISYNELKKNLFYLKKQPNAIPYVTTYYEKNWGLSLTYNNFLKLDKKKFYKVKINSKFKKGFMHYGEYFKKGTSNKEILFTSYLCHPSMGNNELSGPLVLANLMKLIGRRNNYYSYRFVLIPETIGSIAYISKNYKKLRQNVVMGFCLTCLGGEGKHSFVPDRNEGSYVNYLLKDLFQTNKINFKKYSWLDRGSDERQFCSPLVNIPFATIFKTKFGEYEEYHTSLDNKKFLNFSDLKESLKLINNLVKKIEKKRFPIQKFPCEPFLTKYKLHNPINFKNNSFNRDILNVLSFCDGKNDIEIISKNCRIKLGQTKKIILKLSKLKILKFI